MDGPYLWSACRRRDVPSLLRMLSNPIHAAMLAAAAVSHPSCGNEVVIDTSQCGGSLMRHGACVVAASMHGIGGSMMDDEEGIILGSTPHQDGYHPIISFFQFSDHATHQYNGQVAGSGKTHRRGRFILQGQEGHVMGYQIISNTVMCP